MTQRGWQQKKELVDLYDAYCMCKEKTGLKNNKPYEDELHKCATVLGELPL